MNREHAMRRVLAWATAGYVLLVGAAMVMGKVPGERRENLPASVENMPPSQLSVEGKALLQAYLNSAILPDLQYADFSAFRSEAQEFYEASGETLPWVRGRRPSAQARTLVQAFENADEQGLNPVDYDGKRWGARFATAESGGEGEADLVRFDLAVTVSTMRYVSDLHRGRVNPRDVHFDLDIGQHKLDLSEFLRKEVVNAADVSGALQSTSPPFPGYRRTVQALQTYMKLAATDEADQPLPATAKPVKPGEQYAGATRLTRLLSSLGDMPAPRTASPGTTRYEGPVVIAVKHFQERHGLDANGILDPHTLKELNTPLSQRVEQLKLTLERWRWVPHEFERPPLVVNIPEFRVYAVNDKYLSAFEMKVVVGRAYQHKTPVFATQLSSIIFRPYWNVPWSIQQKELVPEIRKDANYLSKHDYEVVDARKSVVSEGDVSQALLAQLTSGKLVIRQRPGAKNSLGLIKFDMPNSYDVYMHDTPAHQLFTRSRRDFSHGCIRVENPVALAEWVLRDQPEWNRERIVDAMNGDKTFRLALAKPIPVLIVYGTAVAMNAGEVHFSDDIYGFDAELESVLAKGYPYAKAE
jgi:murein L,D-transpeptidase YcbB/YkuD